MRTHLAPLTPSIPVQAELVKAFAADIAEVAELFESAKSAPVLSHNAPPYAGAVAWVRGLKARLAEPHAKLAAKEHGGLLESREGVAAAAAYTSVMEAMEAFEAGVIERWCQQVRGWLAPLAGGAAAKEAVPRLSDVRAPGVGPLQHTSSAPTCQSPAPRTPPPQVDCTSEEKLNLPLLQFHEDASLDLPLLAVNFDPALVALLRETKYFLLAAASVPGAAAAIYQRADMYRSQIGSLDLIVRPHLGRPGRRPGAPADVATRHRLQRGPCDWPCCMRPPPRPLLLGVAVQPHPAHHPGGGEAAGGHQAHSGGGGAQAVRKRAPPGRRPVIAQG